MTNSHTTLFESADSFNGPQNRAWSIFLISVLGLFLELMLIRWIGTEIRIFAYLQNTVLVVCFLGLGMGCFTCRKRISMRDLLLPLVVLTAILAIPVTRTGVARISNLLGVIGDLVMWHQSITTTPWHTLWQAGLGLGLTFVLMLLLWEMFIPIGRILGRLMDDHPNTIWAYSVNVAGSLVGIWLFVGLSVLSLPPAAWFLVVGILLLSFLGIAKQRNINLALIASCIALAWIAGREPGSTQVAWSPYQKLVLTELGEGVDGWPGKFCIAVNNTGYQAMIDLRPESVKLNPRIRPEMRGLSQYDIPMLLHPEPNRVLIVGAGSGNDVAGALRGGATYVAGVEIDPSIIEMGRRHHPERPYDSPKVEVINDDARSFFATTDKQFDVIVFGLLDSHTMTAMTNARLDHYVYTKESIERARSLLAKGGVMVLSFEAEKNYIADRMAGCLNDVFGRKPDVFRIPSSDSGWGGVMFVTGDTNAIETSLASNGRLTQRIAKWKAERPLDINYTTATTSDDWPYIYLRSPRIPTLYYLLAGLMVALIVYCNRRLKTPSLLTGWKTSHWHFFFLGAAFLLLEVQNISKASVVLGNTWLVNAVIISSILAMVLLANLLAAKLPRLPQSVVYACLIGTCILLYFVDISQFAFLPYATKAVIVGGLTTLPMLFSGIIFIRSFTQVERKDVALGANLIGGVVGGLLQSVTFVVGIKALLLLVAGLYIAALLTRPRSRVAPADTEVTDTESTDTPEEEPSELALV